MDKPTYYICSYGGCGSTILSEYLSNFGDVKHIHSRNPPKKLTYVGDEYSDKGVYKEWFNDIPIEDNKLKNYKVIYIYRNPLNAIYSRFVLKNSPYINHLQHIQCDNNGFIRLRDVINTKKDLYKIEEFFNNYTTPAERNYKIYCVKYEQFWDNISLFNNIIGVPDIKQLYPIRQENNKKIQYIEKLYPIYYSLINKMNKMNFIEIV